MSNQKYKMSISRHELRGILIKPKVFGIVVNHVYLSEFKKSMKKAFKGTNFKLKKEITLGKRVNHFQANTKLVKGEFLLVYEK